MSERPGAPDRMPTGVPGLDRLLEGGLVRGNSFLVEGPPGSGKTTFAIRMIHEGILRYDEPGLIITFEEFPKQIYQEALAYGVDLAAMERAGKLRVIWTPPSRILEGFTGKNDLIDSIVEELGVRRLVIDSITHFKRVAHEEVHLRELLAEILNYLKLKGINAFLVKELERMDDETIAFEEYLVDASMRVYNAPQRAGGENIRYVEIRKTRGQGHISGRHPFTLSDHGLKVFPNLRPRDVRPPNSSGLARPDAKVPLGVSGVDSMLAGGVWKGSMNILGGTAGTGKSVLSYHFLTEGLEAGESCLLLSLRNSAHRIQTQAQSLGMDWDYALLTGRLEILEMLPIGLSLEEVMNTLHDRIRSMRPGRVVIDSIDDLWGLVRDDDRVRDALLVMGEMAETADATMMVLHELRSKGVAGRSDFSDLASCVVHLTMVETDGELRRFFGIRKYSGADHAKELREFHIDANGFRVQRKPTGLSGILSGNAVGSLHDVADRVIPALDDTARLIRDLEAKANARGESADSVREARANLAIVDVLLREHFGLTDFQQLAEETVDQEAPSDESPGNPSLR